jgi:hypothetical protein
MVLMLSLRNMRHNGSNYEQHKTFSSCVKDSNDHSFDTSEEQLLCAVNCMVVVWWKPQEFFWINTTALISTCTCRENPAT